MNYAQKIEKERKLRTIEDAVRDMKELTYDELAELTGINKNTIKKYTDELRAKNKILIESGKPSNGKGRTPNVICWIDNPTTDKKEEKPMSDPTAAAAMNNIQPSAGKFKEPVKPGDIWWLDATPAYMALVLSVYKGNAQTLLIKEKDNYFDQETDMTIAINDKDFYIQPYRVTCRGTRTFLNKAATFGNDRLAKVLQAVGYYLAIPPVFKVEKVVETVEVPVEKIVEKTVEVPVEKIVEKKVDDPLLAYKAELFDKLFDKLLSAK